MRWCQAGFESSFDALERAVAGLAFGAPPPGFELVGTPRAMRVLFRGSLRGPDGEVRVVVKAQRGVTALDRVARLLRGGNGRREARVAEALSARGIAVPRALAWSESPVDLLVSQEIAPLAPLPAATVASPALVEEVARFIADLHRAGLVHRDLTPRNLALGPQGLVLLDLGGARVVSALSPRTLRRERGRAAAAFLDGASRATRWRALVALLGGDRDAARRDARAIEEEARLAALRYRRGRDRRVTRTGRHFIRFSEAGARGVRDAGFRSESWRPLLAAPTTGGRLERVTPEEGGAPIAAKRFAATLPLRIPRAERSFRLAVAFAHRHIPAPRPFLAVAGRGGSLLLSAWVEGRDLLTAAREAGGPERAALLERAARAVRRLHDAGLSHRDLKASNLLLPTDGRGIVFADLEGARVHRRAVSWRRRARDLARLDASLTLSDGERIVFLEGYVRVAPQSPLPFERFTAFVATRSEWKRRRTARRAERAARLPAPVG